LLLVDDEPDLLTLYELTLVREGYDIDSAGTLAEALALLDAHRYQVVITDMRLPDGQGLELLRTIEAQERAERVVVITAYGSAENAVEALKVGAFDYLTKPVDLKQFRAVVASAAGRDLATAPAARAATAPSVRRERTAAMAASARGSALQRLAGSSPAMQQVRTLVQKVSRSMAPVLVHGESGTGKELVARAVHEDSARAAGPFVAVNCGAIPEQLLEAEFFGYRKGAFTGALEDRDGFFRAAEGGTLFLDEIGDLPLAMQSKLLRVIQERVVRPLGGVSELPAHVRIVSATHKDLAAEVQAGRFRQDLFYRLNVIAIHVPPLRQRMADLPQIAKALLARIAADAGVESPPVLSEAAQALLMRQHFAGNVRELENLLHRALAMTGGERIEAEDLGLAAGADEPSIGAAQPAVAPHDAGAQPIEAGPSAPASHPREPLPGNLQAYLDDVERDILLRALQKHRYNRTAAGESLGLTLRQMRYRMARLGVLSDRDEGDSSR
jgi:two-component system response regulator PilR (NtrC family)